MGSGNSSDTFQSSRPVHLIDDPDLLLRGEFSRDGFDLIITGPDGQVLVVADYFSFNPPPNLMLPGGGGFSPEMVRSLLHGQFDDTLYAGPAGGTAPPVEIGTVAFIVGQVIRKGPNGDEVLKRGDILYKGDEIEVIGAGRILARMNDGTTFRLGQDARAVLNDFEYDEATGTGNFEATVIRGGFNYKSGGISKFAPPGGNHSQISTPTAVIGIRGSELDGTVSPTGETIVIHKSGILTVTDINGDNPVELTQPGNTSVIVLNGNPSFTPQATPEQQATVQQSLPPPSQDEQETIDESTDGDDTPGEGTEGGDDTTGENSGEASGEGQEGSGDETSGEEGSGDDADDGSGDDDTGGDSSDEDAGDGDDSGEGTDGADGTGDGTGDGAGAEGSGADGPGTDGAGADGAGADGSGTDSSGTDSSGTDGSGDSGSGNTSSDGSSPLGSGSTAGTGLTGTGSTGTGSTGTGSTGTGSTGTGSTGSPVTGNNIPSNTPTNTAPPEILPIDNKPIAVNDSVSITATGSVPLYSVLLANDSDPDPGQNPVIVSVNSSNTQGVVAFDATAQTLTYTPNADQLTSLGEGANGTDQFTYQIRTGGLTDVGTVTITLTGVNDAPTANNDSYTVSENTILTVPTATGILANDTDPDTGDTLTVTGATVLTSDQTPIAIQADGSFSFLTTSSPGIDALDAGETLTSQFSYVVTDSGGLTSTAVVTITVQGINDAPVTGADSISVAEASTTVINPLTNDSDPEGDTLIIVGATSSAGTATVSADGTSISYLAPNTLKAGQVTQETITYTVSDGNASSTGTVTVSITGQNDPPIPAAPGSFTPAVIDPSAGPVDIESAILATIFDDNDTPVRITAVDTTGTIGSVILGSVIYDPGSAFDFLNVGETATDTFGFTAQDDTNLSANGTYTVTINGVADAPVVSAPIAVTALDNEAPQTLSLLTGTTDVDATDVLNVSAGSVVITGDAVGVAVTGNSVLITPSNYTFAAGVTSTNVTISYNIIDTTGLTVAQTATITINQSNQAPVVSAPVTLSVSEDGSPVTLDLLQGATDANSDVLTVTGLTVTGNTGGITQSGTTLSIDPLFYNSLAASGSEAITYSYTIDDGKGGTVAQTATITITGANDAPVAVADANAVSEDGTLLMTAAAGVLANDTDVDTGATRTVTAVQGVPTNVGNAVTLASGAVIIMNADGSYDFAPGQSLSVGQTSQEVITYTITDDQGATATAALTITVTGTNLAPTVSVTPAATTTFETASVIGLNLQSTDIDLADVGTFSVDAVTLSTNTSIIVSSGATLTLDGTGALISYDPSNSRLLRGLDSGEQFTDDIFITVDDGNGGSATTTLSIDVIGESSPELLLFSHDGPIAVEPGLDIVGDTTLNLQGARIGVDTLGYQPFQIISFGDTGPQDVTPALTTTDVFALVTANALDIRRDYFAFSENRFVVDDRIATVTIEGIINNVNDNADAYVVSLNANETLVVDIDGAAGQGFAGDPVEISLFDPVGNLLFTTLSIGGGEFDIGSLNTLDPFFTYTALNSGDYHIVVTSAGTVTSATQYNEASEFDTDYTLNLSLVTLQPNEFANNTITIIDETEFESTEVISDLPGFFAGAYELTRDSFKSSPNQLVDLNPVKTVTIVGDFRQNDGADYVKVFLQLNETFTLDIDYAASSNVGFLDDTQVGIEILSSAGASLAAGVDTIDAGSVNTGDQTFTFVAPAAGMYYIRIDPFSQDYGDYIAHFSINDTGQADLGGSGATILDERQIKSPEFRPEPTAFDTSIDTNIATNFGINSFINESGDVLLFGETTPANFETVLQSFTIEGLLSDPNSLSSINFSAIDNSGESFSITTRDVKNLSTEVQLAEVINSNGADGAFLQGSVNSAGKKGGLILSGDFNGDGFDDLLINDDVNSPNSARIIFGSDNLAGDLSLAQQMTVSLYDTAGPGDYQIITDIAFAGDINGDGFDDLIVGLNFSANSFFYNTSAIVFGYSTTGGGNIVLGQSNMPLPGDPIIFERADTTIALGDIDGDGLDDIAVFVDNYYGLPELDIVFGQDPIGISGFNSYGRLDLQAGPILDRLQIEGNLNLPVSSTLSQYTASYDIAGITAVGDIDGDGFNDLLLDFAYSGESLFVLNGGSRADIYAVAGADGAAILSGEEFLRGGQFLRAGPFLNTYSNYNSVATISENNYSGVSNIQSLGDINGDGFDDILFNIVPNSSLGKYLDNVGSFVVFGGPGLNDFSGDIAEPGLTISDLANDNGAHGFVITSSELEDSVFGDNLVLNNVENVGDINGDGFDDLLIQPLVAVGFGYGQSPDKSILGDPVILYGGPSLSTTNGVVDVSKLNGDQGFALKSSQPGYNLTQPALDSIGDINGDGFTDFALFSSELDIYNGITTGYNSIASLKQDGTVIVFGGPGLGTPDNAFQGTSGIDNFPFVPGSQIVRSGAGNDTGIYDPADILIDGGSGNDAIISDRLYANPIDITGPNNLQSIEAVVLGGFGNTLILDAKSVIELSDSNTLLIDGAAGDSVIVSDTGWTFLTSGGGFSFYQKGQASLQISDAVSQSISIANGEVDKNSLDYTSFSPISTTTPLPFDLTTGNTLTKVNGMPVALGTTIALDSGAIITVTDVTSGSEAFDYNPNGSNKFLSTTEFLIDEFTFTTTDGTNEQDHTYRLTVNDPVIDPAVITLSSSFDPSAPLFLQLFDGSTTVTDVDTAFAVGASVQIDMGSPGTGYLSLSPDLPFNFSTNFSSTFTFNDRVELTDVDGRKPTLAEVEQFLQAVQVVPINPGVLNFTVFVNQNDAMNSEFLAIDTSGVPLTTSPIIMANGLWATGATWNTGNVPTSADKVTLLGDNTFTVTIDAPADAGSLYLHNTIGLLSVQDDLTIAGELFASLTSPSAIFSVDSTLRPVSLSANTTITLQSLEAQTDLDLLGSNAITITAASSMELLDARIVSSTTGITPNIFTPSLKLSGASIILDNDTDISFSNPGGRIAVELGNTMFFDPITPTIASNVIFQDADITLTSDFNLIGSDLTGAGLDLAGSATIGGAFTLANIRNDFIWDNDTLLADATLFNGGVTTVTNNAVFNGVFGNAGTMNFAGANVTINSQSGNLPTGTLTLGTSGGLTTNITVGAANTFVNRGDLVVLDAGQTITGNFNNIGSVTVDSGASLTIQNANSLLNLADSDVFLTDSSAALMVNDGDVVINNDTRFTGGLNGTNVFFSPTTKVYNGAAALSVDVDSAGEGLMLRGHFTLGNDALSALVNNGTLDQALSLNGVSLDFGGEVTILEDSVWNLDLDSITATGDNLVFDTVDLTGEIRPRFNNGIFSAGDSFTILSALSLMGSFSFLDSLVDASGTSLFTTPGLLDPGTGNLDALVANIVYDRTPGASSVTLDVLAVTQDDASNGNNPVFIGTPGVDVILGSGLVSEYQNIGAGDVIVDQDSTFEIFRVTALDFARIAATAEVGASNQLSLEAAGEFNFIDLPGTALENITELVLATGSQQTVILDDRAIFNLMDETFDMAPLRITNVAFEGDKVQLYGDFEQGLASTNVEYFSPFSSLLIDDGILVEVYKSDNSIDFYGTSQGETLVGTGGANFIDAGFGNDTIDAQGGNDVVVYDSMDTGVVDGGTEIDTLLLNGGLLDLSGVNNLINFEKIDATGSSLTVNFADLFGTGNFLEPGAIDVFSTDPSFGDHQVVLEGQGAAGLLIEGVNILTDPSFAQTLTNAGVTVGSLMDLGGDSVLPLTKGDVTIFLTLDLTEPVGMVV